MFVSQRFPRRRIDGAVVVKGKPMIFNKIKKKCKIRENYLISQLLELGYSETIIQECIPHLEYYDLNAALCVIYKLLEQNREY